MFHTFYNAEQKLWHGRRSRPIFNPEITLGEALLKSMQVHGPKVAQISDDSGIQLTFDDLRERTICAALNLQQRGYKAGQVITVIAKNSHNLAPIVFAAHCIGCPVNALATSFVKEEVTHMLNITQPSLVFCDVQQYDKMVQGLAECGLQAPIITINGRIDSCENADDLFMATGLEATFRPVPLDGAHAVATILCTSGTSGLSKGASLSHSALLAAQAHFELIQSTDIVWCFSELFWTSGIGPLLWGTLYGATRIITTADFTPELLLRQIEKHKITFISSVVYELVGVLRSESLAKRDLTSVRTCCTRGTKPPPGLLPALNKHFPNGRTYAFVGMTETASIYGGVCTTDEDTGTAGQLLDGIEAIIVDENGSRCGPNVEGELCLRQRYPLLGYYNNAEATAQAFNADGFLLTGDIARFDEANNLYMVDRKKDIIRSDFFHVSPSEIEAVLLRSPEIVCACVFGVPDDMYVEMPAAAVIRKAGSMITKEQICAMIADALPDKYRLRGGVYFMDTFATTASGKVLRRKVREQLIELFSATRSQ